MKKASKLFTLLLALMLMLFAFAACSGGSEEEAPAEEATTEEAAEEAAAPEEEAAEEEEDLGFTEVEIFSGVEKEFLNLNAVYFQPVDMTGGYSHEDYDCHLELDVSALENDLGYGTGDWVPYLTVDYEVTQDGNEVASGTFMPMAASDGPHYGQNIKLNGDGVYSVKFTVKFPDSSTYLIHTDETGPAGHEFPDAIEYQYDEWQFTDGAWAE